MPKKGGKSPEVPPSPSPRKKVVREPPRLSANGHRLPGPMPPGEILTDVWKNKWQLGKSIGLGGFGEIYLASDNISEAVNEDAAFVIKIEHHNSGPLFCEMHFYHRVGKKEQIDEWVEKKKLDYLGMPRFFGSGSHTCRGTTYRFLVMERFGEDLQKLLERNGKTFPLKTVYTLGMRIVDILEYIHSSGYIHADVKASNLLLGYGNKKLNRVYLVDFGLACRYTIDGEHKEYKEDARKAHDGTIEFTSRDAHIGAHSRRGDLEILGYNLLQWTCGRLPWEDNLKDPDYVSSQKSKYMSNIPHLMKTCFPQGEYPEGIAEYLKYVAQLQFVDEPDYNRARNILRNALQKKGYKNDGVFRFGSGTLAPRARSNSPKKTTKSSPRVNCHASPSRHRKTGTPKMTSAKSGTNRWRPPAKRRSTSATPRLQTVKNSAVNEPNHDAALNNPTPAMLLVMQRKLELQQPESDRNKSVSGLNQSSSLMSVSRSKFGKRPSPPSRSPTPVTQRKPLPSLSPRHKGNSRKVNKRLKSSSSQTSPAANHAYSPEI